MRIAELRRLDKTILDWGRWDDGRMGATVFPLSRRRGHSFRLGLAWRWRLVRFTAGGMTCRLLLAFSLAKEQYRATLACEVGQDLAVLASFEYHGTHPGWHVLAACGTIAEVPPGVMIGPWQRRIPRARARHRQTGFGVSDDHTALEAASRFFGLHRVEGRLL